MPRKIAKFARLISDYRFYRGQGYNFRAAWSLARMTIP